jgi:4-hydroxy 2-oxovalerate aldolase
MRDGGYINKWDFSDDFAKNYYNAISEAKIDFIELGFKNNPEIYNNIICGKWRSIKEEYLLNIITDKRAKVSVMVDYSNCDINNIDNKKDSIIDMIRVAFHKPRLNAALNLCNELKKKGYIVCANAMATINYNDEEINKLCELTYKYKIDYLYIADSYGSLTPHDIKILQNKIKVNMNNLNNTYKYKLGIHLHNNKQNAFANMLYALENNFDIIDSTVMGMGRGAGNLCTELLLSHINYNVLPILKFANTYMKPLFSDSGINWGYTIEYLISAHFNCHPNYISKLKDYNITDIEVVWNVISNLKQNDKHKYFDIEYLNTVVHEHM